MRALAALLLLTACSHQPLAPMLTCVSHALESPVVPRPDVRLITQGEMADRFGPYQGYFTTVRTDGRPTIWLVRAASRSLLAHEAARAVQHAAGRPFTAEADTKARRNCG